MRLSTEPLYLFHYIQFRIWLIKDYSRCISDLLQIFHFIGSVDISFRRPLIGYASVLG